MWLQVSMPHMLCTAQGKESHPQSHSCWLRGRKLTTLFPSSLETASPMNHKFDNTFRFAESQTSRTDTALPSFVFSCGVEQQKAHPNYCLVQETRALCALSPMKVGNTVL